MDEASSETVSHNFLIIDLDSSRWIHVRRTDLIPDRVDSVSLGQIKESSRVSSLRRRIADIARGSMCGEEVRRLASLRASELGSFCLMRLKIDSAWDRCSLEVDMRWEIRVSNGAGSAPSMAASWACWY